MNIQSNLPILSGGDTYRVTSPFGWRVDPVTGQGNGQHKGIDLVLWKGYGTTAPICAAWDGVVTYVRDSVDGFSRTQTAGNYVIIDHGDGVVTKYYHLRKDSVEVVAGEQVTAGQQIGYMGSTGYSTGAHLHFQLEIDGEPVDPEPFITGEVPDASPEPSESVGDGANDSEAEMDNTPAEWSAEAVQWAVDNGIMYGDENGNYKLRDACTREMMLVFLYRALGGGS